MKTIYIVLFIFLFSHSCIAQSFTFPTSGSASSAVTAPDGVTLVSSISSTGCAPGGGSNFIFSTSHVSSSAIYRNTSWAAGCKNSTDIIKLDFSTVTARPLGMKFSIYDVDNGADSVSVKVFSNGVLVDYSYRLFSPVTYVTANGSSPTMGFHGSGSNNSGLDDNSGRIEISTVDPLVRVDSILICKYNNLNTSGNPSQSFGAFDWSNSTVLPIKLLSFSAYQNAQSIHLNWRVAQEIATKEYQIEYSENGSHFTQLGKTIPSKNVIASETDYTYTAMSPSQAKVLYLRLVNIDVDGKKFFSKTIKVSQTQVAKSEVYLNTFKNSFSVAVQSENAATGNLRLISIDGKMLYQKTVSLSKGHNLIPVEMSTDISRGLYIVAGEFGNGLSFRHKLIKE